LILISYDIADNKLRTRFNKFIRKFGGRLQYSVYEITHSKNMLDKIKFAITTEFEKQFTQEDSVMIFVMSNTCSITRFGYAKNDELDVLVVE